MVTGDDRGVLDCDRCCHVGIDVISLAPGTTVDGSIAPITSWSASSDGSRLACGFSRMPLTGASCSMCSASSDTSPNS